MKASLNGMLFYCAAINIFVFSGINIATDMEISDMLIIVNLFVSCNNLTNFAD